MSVLVLFKVHFARRVRFFVFFSCSKVGIEAPAPV